jgi:predicted aldo/keto reductase-like oxidoreductase
MEYRRLGRTERQVSLLGVGGGYVMFQDVEGGTRLYERAAELGVNYFDGRYGHSTLMQRSVIRRDRERFIIGSKTASTSREDALRRVDEDLAELDTPYVDVYYLRAYNHAMIDAHFAPGGSIEGLLEARRQGKIRWLGLAGHSDLTALARGVQTGLIDVVQFPLNVARREALATLVPVCQKHDAGMVIMKPMNVGLAPAEVCLPWLANQPIHVMAPGMSNIEHLELDARVLDRQPMALSEAEAAEAERWRQELGGVTCHICDKACQSVCEPRLPIDWLLYHNVFQNELRRLGPQGFVATPFAPWVKQQAEGAFSGSLAHIDACTRCRRCEEVCPYGLPIVDLLGRMRAQQAEVLEEIRRADWSSLYQDAHSPLPKKATAPSTELKKAA